MDAHLSTKNSFPLSYRYSTKNFTAFQTNQLPEAKREQALRQNQLFSPKNVLLQSKIKAYCLSNVQEVYTKGVVLCYPKAILRALNTGVSTC